MNTVEYATPENFEAWRQEAATMSIDVLIHTIQDCRNAEKSREVGTLKKVFIPFNPLRCYGIEQKKCEQKVIFMLHIYNIYTILKYRYIKPQ